MIHQTMYTAQLTGMATAIMANIVINLSKYGIPVMRLKMSQVGSFQQPAAVHLVNFHTIQHLMQMRD